MATRVDKLKVLSGEKIILTDKHIVLYQPTLRQIKNLGEDVFFEVFGRLCAIPSSMKSFLWDECEIDYMEISDWKFFCLMSRGLPKEVTSLVFGEQIDFSNIMIVPDPETEEYVLVDKTTGFFLTEQDYNEIIEYLREIIGHKVKREKAANSFTKKILIDDDRKQRKLNSKKEPESILSGIIISLVNTEEFSYTYDTVFDMTVYQLMKSYMQIQNKKQSCALLQGSFSGFVDTSKIKSSQMQWTYDENKFKNI